MRFHTQRDLTAEIVGKLTGLQMLPHVKTPIKGYSLS